LIDSWVARRQSIFTRMAQGSPYFCREIATFLRASRLLRYAEDGRIEVLADDATLEKYVAPSSLEAALRARIDCLEPAVQKCLKVAAVVAQV